jgi:hypothetical protein
MTSEERDDFKQEITSSANTVPVHVFFVTVVPFVDVYGTNAEELLQSVENMDAPCALRDCELVRDLITGDVPAATWSVGLTDKVYGEASFAIDKTKNPAHVDQVLRRDWLGSCVAALVIAGWQHRSKGYRSSQESNNTQFMCVRSEMECSELC